MSAGLEAPNNRNRRRRRRNRPTANKLTRRALFGGGLTALAALLIRCSHQPADPTATSASSNSGSTPRTSTSVATRGTATPGPVIFLDPGHGGVDEGAIGSTSDGRTVLEKTVTLALALQTQAYLEAAGFAVLLSRTTDTLPGVSAADLTPDGSALTPDGVLRDLQRRIDRANASGARLFLSIHLNANDDPSARGTETYDDLARSFAADNQRFAQLVQHAVITALHTQGYDTPDRGVIDDAELEASSLGTLPDSYNHLVLLGPAIPGLLRPTEMPGALNEALFLSNPDEATAADDPAVQALIASAYAAAVQQFFA